MCPGSSDTFYVQLLYKMGHYFVDTQYFLFVKGSFDTRKTKHDGVRYPCDQCDFMATRKADVKRHKQTKHKGNGICL